MPVAIKQGVYPQPDGGCLLVTPSRETANGTRSKWLTKEQVETVLGYFAEKEGVCDESEAR
jgi:hypothetical protein